MARSHAFLAHRPATDLLSLLGLGRVNARPAAHLAAAIGVSERSVRGSVEHLRREGHLIGSTTTSGGGFYLVQTREELEDTARQFRSRALAMLTTKRAMERSAAQRFGPEVLRLFAVDELEGASDGKH